MAISISSAAYSNIISDGSPGKVYIPVSRTALIYSHFDHVSGVVASKEQGGVSITKLQILNALIDRLSNIKGEKIVPKHGTSADEINLLIENYQSQIHNAIESAKETSYGLAGARPEPGELFSLVA